jgi:transposase
MDENRVLTQLLGTRQLEVNSSILGRSEEIYLTIEQLLQVAACPNCGEINLHEYDRGDEHQVRGIAMAELQGWLLYRPRRFRCERCQKTFVERVEWRRAGMSYTTRYERYFLLPQPREHSECPVSLREQRTLLVEAIIL